MKKINHMKQMKSVLLTLCLIMAGAQSALADEYVETLENDGKKYYVYYTGKFLGENQYCASLANITATGDVVIPASFAYYKLIDSKWHHLGTIYVNYVGWWPDQQKAEDITCTADMSSLSFDYSAGIEIHGHFTLQKLYGSLTFPFLSSSFVSTIASDATLDIPHVNALNCNSLKVDGTILAPALQQLTLKSTTTVNGTITAANATQAIIGGTVNSSGKVNAPAATQLNISQGAKVFGSIYAMATKVNIASGTQVTGLLYVPVATNIVMDANSFDGTISSNSLTSIKLGQTNFGTSGKLQCPNLTDIYIPSKTALPTFYGQYSDHFTAPSGSITVHVYDMTANEIAAMKNSVVWNGFKQIVNHKSEVSYTLTNNSSATVSFYGMNDNDYPGATSLSQYAQVVNGSKTGTVKAESNYAVVIMGIDFDSKNVTLKRNGSAVALKSFVDQGSPVRYYNELDLQQNVSYEVSVSDKTCTLTFNQTGYTGRIMYQKTLNSTTSTGVVTSASPTVTCAQGSQLKLTIPYDPTSYTPNKLYLGGSEVTMTKANGEATATITVPTSASAQIDLTWQAPQQTYETHQPQIMIMRSGEGQVVFKGAICLPSDEWSQYLDDYEQSGLLLSGRDGYETWVMTGNGPVSCTQTVTNVTAPCVDPRGEDSLDEGSWGFIIEITPVAGQKLKTLLLGRISEDELSWEDMVSEGYSNGSYVTYDASTNTYTFDIRGDYMNFGVGDYVVNIAMGPEETAVETGQTFNFVRKGGRGEAWIYWEDDNYENYFNEDGSYSVTIPNEQLTVDMRMHIQLEEGETFHVYKDGVDITSQFQYNEGTDYFAELDMKSATYTILIDDAPDANPTWSIHNETEGDVVVEQTLKDGTTTTTTYAGNLNDLVIDDTQVSKVTLKVYAENANEAKPVRVLVNGQDVSYQFSTKQNDGDGVRLCYEVPVSELTNCSWDISYNTDRPQTFVVKGGTCNLLMEFYYENLEKEPVLDISPNDGPATVYLPPFNSEWNRYVNMTVNADEYEGLTIKRNGIDVTNYFTKTVQSNGKKYYELDIAEGDLEGNSTVGLLSFDIREAAVWEIVYKSIDEQETKFSIINHDQLALRAVRSYVTGGAPAIQPISQDH